ncbi:hypothetical protein GCM10011502_26170 [Oceanisphaera marina]|uniref:Uncharacterized protein n=1 Tax=Oceanisphaera marina TaxID=2017550 RepID=A0ABQ1ITN6_9GAMM|nr:hypothetical protein [Oceanisphaera marina]GGB51788.1 hypothetical protein GCM10011502_26170 [Oceanisphaera marina]
MNLTLAAAAFCNWQLAAPVLRQLTPGTALTVTGLENATALGQLEQQLAEDHTGAVVLYAPLHLALEQAANVGTEPSQAVSLWRHNTAQLVRFCKQYRGQVLLFSLVEVLAAPQLFKTLCTQRWPELEVATPSVSAIEHPVAVLHHLVAQSLRSSSAELNTQEQQLAALAQPLEDEASAHIPLTELNQLVANMQAGQQARTGLQHAEQQLQQQQQHLARLTDEKNTAQSALVELQQENTLLLEQLHQVQETLESNLQTQQQNRSELEQQQFLLRQQTARNKELEVALQRSEKLLSQEKATRTEQVRKHQALVDDLQQENVLLLEQLFCVQEELEKHFVSEQLPSEREHAPALPAEDKPASPRLAASFKTQLKKRVEKKKLQRKAAELAASPLFNAEWYLKQYPDVAADKVFTNNPALHYLKCGGFEGRNPSPDFDSRDYLNANPDVAVAGFNPLYHYLRFGQAEKRPLY